VNQIRLGDVLMGNESRFRERAMTETIDTICDVEDAIADLEAIIDAHRPDPRLVSELQRLDDRLRHLEQAEPVFAQPA
jgi:hypothetical protein